MSTKCNLKQHNVSNTLHNINIILCNQNIANIEFLQFYKFKKPKIFLKFICLKKFDFIMQNKF